MSDELKPCPFCGGEAEYFSRPNTLFMWAHEVDHWVSCASDDCLADMGLYAEKDRAIAAWNRRADLHEAELARLRARNAEMDSALNAIAYFERGYAPEIRAIARAALVQPPHSASDPIA